MAEREPRDEALFDAWRRGEQASGDRLIRRYYTGVFRFFELRVPAAAEDLTQRTLLGCIEAAEGLELKGTFRSYLFGIAWRQLQRHWRDSARSQGAVSYDEGESEPQARFSLSTLVSRRKEHQLLLCALETLPLELQSAIGLHYWEGLRATEIAEVFGLPASTMRTRLGRARQLLRAEIEALSPRARARDVLLSDLDGWARSADEGIELPAPTVQALVAARANKPTPR